MEKLTQQQQEAAKKMSMDRLHLKLMKAGCEEETVLGLDRANLMNTFVIYKRFKGSGISDILVAAGVVADGSIHQAMHGKHFNRGVHCL